MTASGRPFALSAKIFAVVVALELAIGTPAILLLTYFYRQYEVTMTEVVNAPLARTIAAELMGAGDRGGPLEARAGALFSKLMAVNPTIEIYLLDPQGRIAASTTDVGDLARKTVDLRPIQSFVRNDFMFPLLGPDPRRPQGEKIFSAAALEPAADGAGFVYVILGGADVDAVSRRLQTGFVAQGAGLLAAAGLLAGLLTMVYMHRDVARRLRRIGADMDAFRDAGSLAGQGDLREAVGGNDEITALAGAFREMARRIETLIARLGKTDEDRRDFVATVSHDLQVPITSAKAHLETVLLKGAEIGPARQAHYIEVALKQIERLSGLTDELFELAKLEAPGFPLSREIFAVSDLVQDVAQKFALAAADAGVALRTMPDAASALVDGDIALIERVIDNLIENAIRHTPRGGSIDVSVAEREGVVAVAVADTGPGIAPDHLQRIFERFYRVEHTRSSGAGLGLAIARRIVEMHSGALTVRSVVGAGATFEIALPRATAAGRPLALSPPSS